MTTICLAMIVKDEAAVIRRCLESVRPWIDLWVVVDTGSTDGTQDIVREVLGALPGDLYERPWVDFSTNRNAAVSLAEDRGPDYVLVIDADDVLVVDPDDVTLRGPCADSYEFCIKLDELNYYRKQLFRSRLGFHYEGVVHEVLVGPEPAMRCPGISMRVTREGSRSKDPDKYRKDAELLERELRRNPKHGRTAFYLAQSLRDAGEPEKALFAYENRVDLGGWGPEVFWAMVQVARLSEQLRSSRMVIEAYLRAYGYRPWRAEPLCYLATYLRTHDRVIEAYPFALHASHLRMPDDVLFVDREVYDWRALDEVGISAYYAGQFVEGVSACSALLTSGKLPAAHRARLEKNLEFNRQGALTVRAR
jgi:hypothetical protein